MNTTLIAASASLLASATICTAADDVPQRLEFARYEPMMNRSPFAVATAPVATPPPAPNFAKDWYIANAARAADGDTLVTIASSTDKNFKVYLTSKEPVQGISLANTEWSDKVGGTKVTVSKDGQFATLTFNQALLAQPVATGGQAPQQPVPQAGQPPVPTQQVQPQGATPPPGQNPGTAPIKPAPIPTLPTPPPRVRSVIQRNPNGQPAAQPVPTPELTQE